MGRQRLIVFAIAATAAIRPATAQIAPGVRLPSNIAEAVMMAHVFGCVAAVTNRPANGLTIPLAADATGVAVHTALPEPLRARVGPLSPKTKYLSLASPDGDAWIAFDPEAKKCAVTAVAANPDLVGAEARLAMDRVNLPRLTKPSVTDASGTSLPTYDWEFSGTPKLGTPAGHLRVVIDAKGTGKGQVLLISSAIKSE